MLCKKINLKSWKVKNNDGVSVVDKEACENKLRNWNYACKVINTKTRGYSKQFFATAKMTVQRTLHDVIVQK